MDHGDEMLAEVEEPPEDLRSNAAPKTHKSKADFSKHAQHPGYNRRESLLTRQLHSEPEHSDEDSNIPSPPNRALSTQSTWSSHSTTSTAELTSDDGRSMASPAISPPLPPTHVRNALPILEKPLDKKLQIVAHEDTAASDAKESGSEKSVEATLGRKRCIMFACGGKDKSKTPPPPAITESEKPVPSSPPKRKCMIKFACPTEPAANQRADGKAQTKRPVSPPPRERRSSASNKLPHRGSDSTVTHISPKSIRTSSAVDTTASASIPREAAKETPIRRLSSESKQNSTEALRFHEFASSDDEPEEWCQESTCHRSRLTVDDTLKKENVIRKACEEVEEEAIEEEEEDAEDEVDVPVTADDDPEEDDDQDDESEGSDAGFHSDDEEGFAASDSEGEDSDYEWWKPGGSTAATSVEHLDRFTIQSKQGGGILGTSIGSASSGHLSPRSSRQNFHGQSPRRKRSSRPISIAGQREDADLPDSTDFVCGTLDEDRPLEQAYINRRNDLEAAKRKARPQDIDPSFPTSDPEMDEEDDEDLDDHTDSEAEADLVHGSLEELNSHAPTRGLSPTPKRTTVVHRSPPPPTRHHSPPPPAKRRAHHTSPPPTSRRGTARSPPPRKLFGQSPKRVNSPAPGHRMTSPPNTRRPSPTGRAATMISAHHGLAERPQLTHTASLPRGGFLLSQLGSMHDRGHDDASDTMGGATSHYADIPKRGAIDIVKGLEKKRQRRKEKAWQKLCEKNAAKGEKAYKVKPGKGAERMREVGLELQRYHGKGEHILSC